MCFLKFDIWVINSKILSVDDYSIVFCMEETYVHTDYINTGELKNTESDHNKEELS